MSDPQQPETTSHSAVSPPVDFLRGARAVCRFTMPMTLWSRRTLLISLLVVFLPLAAALFLAVKAIPAVAEEMRLPGFVIYSNAFQIVHYYVLLLALFYGTAVVAEEIDNRTLTYLFTRPVDKAAILVGKASAAWIIGALILIPAIGCSYLLLTFFDGLLYTGNTSSFWVNLPTFLGDLVLMLGALAVYVAGFTFIGALFNRPVLWGIAIAFGWESWVAFVPGITRKLTVMHYVQSLSQHATGRNVAIALLGQQSGTAESVFALIVIFILFTSLAIWTFRRREYNYDLSQR
jgi:ABC-type transport system involved in multi-copper enzyme maturation permease subunit